MTRYALYFAPPEGPLAGAAARWLGRDAATGALLPQPHPALPPLTTSARRYGFHATLKAPFRLAEGQQPAALCAALDQFAARRQALRQPLRVAMIEGFLALLPDGEAQALNTLAAEIVEAFEPFRAPLTAPEVARRNPEALTPRQRLLLERWGYPFVFEGFRFHMTLTDRLDPAQEALLHPLAKAHFGPLLAAPVLIGDLVVFVEGADGTFHQLHRARMA